MSIQPQLCIKLNSWPAYHKIKKALCFRKKGWFAMLISCCCEEIAM